MPQTNQAHHEEYILHREVNELYISMAIKKFGVALISIFEPIYIFLFFGESLSWTLLYYIFIYLGYGILVIFGAKITARIGVKHSILLSVPFLILYFAGLHGLSSIHWLIYIIPLASILYKICFWPAYHLDFARFSQQKQRGRQVSIMRMLHLGMHIIGPLVGGFIIAKYDFPVLFGIVIILLFISTIPLFFSREIFEPFTCRFKDILHALKGRRHRRPLLAMVGWAFEGTVNVFFWPIYMFIIVVDYTIVGSIHSGVALVAVVFAYIMGRLADRVDRRKMMRVGSILTVIAWLIRGFTKSGLQIAVVDIFYRFAGASAGIPFKAKMYDWENQEGPHQLFYIVLREFAINIGRVLMLTLAGVLIFATGEFALIFVIAAIMSLLLFLF